MTAPSYLSAADFARRFALQSSHVSALIRRGELRAIRIGRAVRIPIAEVSRFEREREVRPARVSITR